MISFVLIALINLWCFVQNTWRRLWRRRVDYVRLEIRGTLPEFADEPVWWQRLLTNAKSSPSLVGLRRKLRRIAADPHVKGVLLVVDDFNGGWATAESLREALATFREQGKRVVVYLHNVDTRTYFAIGAADFLAMTPMAYLYLLGLRVEARFLRDALMMAGIEAEVTAVSPYKTGADQFVRSEMSAENREQLERLLDQRYEILVTAIAQDRKLAAEQVHELIDNAPYVASAAHAAGLIDAVCYEDELKAYLTEKTHTETGESSRQTIRVRDWPAATSALRVPYRQRHPRVVAVVSVEGIITGGESRTVPIPLPVLGGAQAGSESIIQALRRVERSKRIAALVLHVDSPGGDAFASDLIWREVLRVRQQKPVVVSMGNLAASGGYYVSACANTIVAHASTITGSIGVYTLRPIASNLLQRIGVNTTVLSRGARTGLLTGTQPPTDDERAVTHQTVVALYDEFKQRVSSGRNMPLEQLDPVAGGRIWTGEEARQLGLVDELGGLPAAVAKARLLANLPANMAAPVFRIRLGKRRDRLLPQPFPNRAWGELPVLFEEIWRPRLLALLPWEFKD